MCKWVTMLYSRKKNNVLGNKKNLKIKLKKERNTAQEYYKPALV